MRKEIRITDQKRGIVQVTIADERWYMRERENPDTKLPEFQPVPSVTWIAGHYPKGIGFYKWLAEKGWDEAQAIKQAAGDKGSKVHLALAAILNGKEVRIDSKFLNKSSGREEELTLEEVDGIKSFVDWKTETERDYICEWLAWDGVVFSDTHNYAGSYDLVVRLTPREGGKNPLKIFAPTIYVVDFKTSQYVWPEFELQLSAYRKGLENGENPIFKDNKLVDVSALRTAVLQVGYGNNKKHWKWTELSDQFDLFLAAQKIWAHESGNQKPSVREYPIVLSPGEPMAAFEMAGEDVLSIEADIPVAVGDTEASKGKTHGERKGGGEGAQALPKA